MTAITIKDYDHHGHKPMYRVARITGTGTWFCGNHLVPYRYSTEYDMIFTEKDHRPLQYDSIVRFYTQIRCNG